ncbi:MAG: hypothetical protein R2795_03990 [Saprospiraceae bacterium]
MVNTVWSRLLAGIGWLWWTEQVGLHTLAFMQVLAGIPSLLLFAFYGKAYLRLEGTYSRA